MPAGTACWLVLLAVAALAMALAWTASARACAVLAAATWLAWLPDAVCLAAGCELAVVRGCPNLTSDPAAVMRKALGRVREKVLPNNMLERVGDVPTEDSAEAYWRTGAI